MTGSRLLFWLHAFTSAFNDSGYWSGVVICFSMRQPITRASIGESSIFMGRHYHKREQRSLTPGNEGRVRWQVLLLPASEKDLSNQAARLTISTPARDAI